MSALVITLVILGLAFIFIEFFIPGGIVGVIGGALIVAAIVAGYVVEGPIVGTFLLIASLILGALLIPLWMNLFPRTVIGKQMTLSKNLPSGVDDHPNLQPGMRGVTVTPLRPSGTARFGGERLDVVSEGRLVPSGAAVEIARVEGRVIVVRPATE